jgi:hypothetical protein
MLPPVPLLTDKTKPPAIGPALDPTAIQKAQAAFLQKQLEDELDLYRAHAKQVQQIEAEQFDQGLISIGEYYDPGSPTPRRDLALILDLFWRCDVLGLAVTK